MADATGPAGEPLSWLERLARSPGSFDFHAALRRIEAAYPDKPRLGQAVRPAEEPVRLGQTPSLGFEPHAIVDFTPSSGDSPATLLVGFLGLWGPNGPLPLHFTEYARERVKHVGDRTLVSFLDVFHHRMLLLFHRAWAQTQPAPSLDRFDVDSFAKYLGAFFGLGFEGTRDRDGLPDRAKIYYAGRFSAQARGAEGLRDIVADYFKFPTRIQEFMGDWLTLPPDCRWQLGIPGLSGLGSTAILGGRVWSRSDRFRIVLGPLSQGDFNRMRPGSEGMAALVSLVRLYTNDEWGWDVRLTLDEDAASPMRLGHGARLGWTSRVGQGAHEDLVFDPMSMRTQRIRATANAS
ncbi:MAG TPA: type VI secretion system baseplate subunit TssG [Polyangiaceae bacterium]|jgi:type VI secretion system protein ImpH